MAPSRHHQLYLKSGNFVIQLGSTLYKVDVDKLANDSSVMKKLFKPGGKTVHTSDTKPFKIDTVNGKTIDQSEFEQMLKFACLGENTAKTIEACAAVLSQCIIFDMPDTEEKATAKLESLAGMPTGTTGVDDDPDKAGTDSESEKSINIQSDSEDEGGDAPPDPDPSSPGAPPGTSLTALINLIKKYQKDNKDLKGQLKTKQTDYDDLQKKHDNLQKTYNDLNDKYDKLKTDNDTANDQVKKLNKDLKDANDDKDRLQKKLDNAEKERDNCEKEKGKTDKIQKKLDDANKKINDLNDDLDSAHKRIKRLNSDVTHWKKKEASTKKKLQKSEDHVQTITRKHKRLVRKYNDLLDQTSGSGGYSGNKGGSGSVGQYNIPLVSKYDLVGGGIGLPGVTLQNGKLWTRYNERVWTDGIIINPPSQMMAMNDKGEVGIISRDNFF